MVSLLIIDDDREIRNAILYQMDWKALNISQVRTAQNGLDALAVMEEFVPDIILCDDDMPGMNGFQFGYCVREKKLSCKIIYMGESYDVESLHAALRIRAVDFVRKPLDMGKLYGVSERLAAESMLEKTTAMQKYAMGMDEVSFYESPVKNSRYFEGGQEVQKRYRQAVLSGGVDEGVQYCEGLTGEIAVCGDERVYYIAGIYYGLLGQTIQLTAEMAPENSYTDEEEGQLWEEIHSLRTLRGLEEFLLKSMERIPHDFGEGTAVNVRKVINYIRINYSDPELSVNFLAQKFFLNKAYLCTVFKKETGKTLNDYIIETRMEAAKSLLQGDIHIYEISDMVGISNSNYFARSFKKYTGMSPSEYREDYYM